MKGMFDKILDFLAQYDFMTLMKLFRNLKMEQVLHNPMVWVVTIAFVGFCVMKKRLKYLVLAVSLLLFLLLLSYTIPEGSGTISTEKMLKFIGGTVALFAVNFYLVFIRDV